MDGLVIAPGTAVGKDFWDPVFALFDLGWPDMSPRAAKAARLGAPWQEWTTTFTWWERGKPLSHVGVLEHPVVLDGERRLVAGVHAVVTHPEHRRKRLAARLLQAAAKWIDERCYDSAKLHTDYPDLYALVGFRVAPMHRFHAVGKGGGGPARTLDAFDPTHLRRIRDALAARTPPSLRFSTADSGWLPLVDVCLARVESRLFHAVDGAPWIGAWDVTDRVLAIHDVIGPTLPTRRELYEAVAEPFDRVVWRFCPDLFDPDAVPVEVPASEGVLQVRGRWSPSGPIGIPTTWEH